MDYLADYRHQTYR